MFNTNVWYMLFTLERTCSNLALSILPPPPLPAFPLSFPLFPERLLQVREDPVEQQEREDTRVGVAAVPRL